MSLVIFSDESGRWSDPGCETYVRSFFIIEKSIYIKFKDAMKAANPDLKLKWVKSGHYRNKPAFCSFLFEFGKVYTVFTDMEQFRTSDYKLRRAIEEIDLEDVMAGHKYKFDIRSDLKNKVDQLLFLHIYERGFLSQLKLAIEKCIGNPKIDHIYFDNPQHNNDDFLKIVSEELGLVKNEVTFIKNDEEEIGIGIADLISGSVNDILNGNSRRSGHDFYVNHISGTALRSVPNPSYIFYKSAKLSYDQNIKKLWAGIKYRNSP